MNAANRLLVSVLGLAILLCSCGYETKAVYSNMALSDLGGVYSSSADNIDFTIEISGILSEDTESLSEISENQSGNDDKSSFDKLMRWGTKKNQNHMTPNFNPGSEVMLKKYNSSCIGDTKRNVIYLTFDEGYENGYTATILDVLRDNNVKAIFFITGPYLKSSQELVRRMVEEGHEVGNHTIHHPSLPGLEESDIEEEVLGLDRVFSEKFGKSMRFLRPPRGEYSERSLSITSKLGYRNLFWSFAYEDWYTDRHRGADYAYDIIMRNLHNGAVLLLHAVSRDNTEALDRIIKDAREKGYIFGEPEELLFNPEP